MFVEKLIAILADESLRHLLKRIPVALAQSRNITRLYYSEDYYMPEIPEIIYKADISQINGN